MKRLRSVLSHRWMRAFPALLTILLLAPAPVLAFTFVGQWTQVSEADANTIQKPAFTSTDTAKGGTLVVDMGKAKGDATVATASIEVSRQIKIANATEEQVTVESLFQSLLQNANLRVKVWFDPIATGSGAHFQTAINFRKNAGSNPKTASDDRTRVRLLKAGNATNAGNYVIHVRIQYATNGNAGVNQWDNTGPSPHTFTFTGS